MKRTKILAYIVNFYSMSAVAGYECALQLAHTENLKEVVAEKVISIPTGEMRSGSIGSLFVESLKGKRKTFIEGRAVLSGWEGEEDLNLVMMRTTEKRSSLETGRISETITLKGDQIETAWFDNYKLDVNCKMTT
jgi:hypothetical protein